jgi:hypothetical protein
MPASPEDLRRRISANNGPAGILSPADEEDIDAEFLGQGESARTGVREVSDVHMLIRLPLLW